jgi:hypothetical protein
MWHLKAIVAIFLKVAKKDVSMVVVVVVVVVNTFDLFPVGCCVGKK